MFAVRILALAFVALVVAEPEADPAAKKTTFYSTLVEEPKRWTLEDLKRSYNTDFYKRYTTEAPKYFWGTTETPKLYWSTTEAAKRWPYYNYNNDATRYNGFNLYNRFAEDYSRYNNPNKYWGSNYFTTVYGNNYPQVPDLTNFQPQIISDKDQQQYVLNLSSYKQLSLTVKVRGEFIYIQGHEEVAPSFNQNYVSLNQFVHTFVLPPYARGSDVTAVLSVDGYLIVTAPIKAYGYVSSVDYDVPVTISDKPYLQKPFSVEIVSETTTTKAESTKESKA